MIFDPRTNDPPIILTMCSSAQAALISGPSHHSDIPVIVLLKTRFGYRSVFFFKVGEWGKTTFRMTFIVFLDSLGLFCVLNLFATIFGV